MSIYLQDLATMLAGLHMCCSVEYSNHIPQYVVENKCNGRTVLPHEWQLNKFIFQIPQIK